MDFPDYFADAESDFDQADFILFGVPFEKTSSFRHGAHTAPREIRQASWNFESYDFRTGVDLRDIKIHDYGNVDIERLKTTQMIDTVKDFTSTVLKKQKIPIALGGEHSITPGIIASYSDDIAVLSLDAHMDFRNTYESDPNNHACVIQRIAEHIPIENIALFGVRSVEQEELTYANQKKLLYLDTYSIYSKGIQKSIQEIKLHFKDKNIYLTFDIDVIDPAYAPGTSTPEPFGLTPFDILSIIDAFSSQIVGFDIVEVCPTYDYGETALLAAKFVRILIGCIWKTKQSLMD
jgi:agmatinase